MKPGHLPLDEQLTVLLGMLSQNPVLVDVLYGTAQLNLPNWYLTGGCVFQTAWNVITGRPPTEGIGDYDVFYCDTSDLSWDAENKVIEAGHALFQDTPVEIRNQARVHLWYEDKFGVPATPHESSEAAIDSFAGTTCCIGVRLDTRSRRRVYAPHGLSDLFNLVVRPNPVLAPPKVYETKTGRWLRQWPDLTIMPWPGHAR